MGAESAFIIFCQIDYIRIFGYNFKTMNRPNEPEHMLDTTKFRISLVVYK